MGLYPHPGQLPPDTEASSAAPGEESKTGPIPIAGEWREMDPLLPAVPAPHPVSTRPTSEGSVMSLSPLTPEKGCLASILFPSHAKGVSLASHAVMGCRTRISPPRPRPSVKDSFRYLFIFGWRLEFSYQTINCQIGYLHTSGNRLWHRIDVAEF